MKTASTFLSYIILISTSACFAAQENGIVFLMRTGQFEQAVQYLNQRPQNPLTREERTSVLDLLVIHSKSLSPQDENHCKSIFRNVTTKN